MSMNLPKSGVSQHSAKHYVIDSAVLVRGARWDESEKKVVCDSYIGATADGGTININQTYRKIAADGTAHIDVKGHTVKELAEATFSANVKELTAENLRLALNGTISELPDSEYVRITSKRLVDDGDYIDSIGICGRLAGSSRPIVFILQNVLITSPLELATTDGSETTVALTGKAHASIEQLQTNVMPWEIYYPTIDLERGVGIEEESGENGEETEIGIAEA